MTPQADTPAGRRRRGRIGAAAAAASAVALIVIATAGQSAAQPQPALTAAVPTDRAVRLDERVRGDRPPCPFAVAVEPSGDDYQLVRFLYDGDSRDDPRVRPDRSLREWADGPPRVRASSNCQLAVVDAIELATPTHRIVPRLLIDVMTGETVELVFNYPLDRPSFWYPTVDGFVNPIPTPGGWDLVDILTGDVTASFETGRSSGEEFGVVSAEGRTIVTGRHNTTRFGGATYRVHRAGDPRTVFRLTTGDQLALSPSGNLLIHHECGDYDGVPIGGVANSTTFYCLGVVDLRSGQQWRFHTPERFGSWGVIDDRTLTFCGLEIGRFDFRTRAVTSQPHPVIDNEVDRQHFCQALHSTP